MLQDIREIIYGFASENRIYSNEAQFQHDLAISLEKLGYDVYLEVLSINANSLDEFKAKNKNERIKLYTDIAIKISENEYIAIELKYKTEEETYFVNGKNYLTFHQGAYDNGTYDYLCDVKRLEDLVNGKYIFNLDKNNVVLKGYAIILTNDKHYCEKRKTISPWYNFSLPNGRTIQGNLNWSEKGNEVDIIGCDKKCAGRENPLSLSGSYTCKWEDYDIGCKVKKPLKFMIFEIENKDW